MALPRRLEFRQSQSLVMTPQLMQAIKLLQLSNLDLVAFVEEELERNPLLERAPEDDGPVRGEGGQDLGAGSSEGGEGSFDGADLAHAESGDHSSGEASDDWM